VICEQTAKLSICRNWQGLLVVNAENESPWESVRQAGTMHVIFRFLPKVGMISQEAIYEAPDLLAIRKM
jgi:hypothetical protein